ncbi:hypothetical protein [Nocardioides sp.]|uniref:hypothetical protein n=1 Tax=Nocardioides sp. TaxID=35761 RepID=UPI00199FF5ED|nr:hypothetical protein [Nocardioides sp.]MBC7278764.1 hypothetical protein [Nocardioides sp.]
MLRHAVLTTALTVALTSALAGCGEEEGTLSQARDYANEPGNQIAEHARTAMHDLDTVHVEGDVLDSEGTKITVDLDVSAEDTCVGKVSIGEGEISLRAIAGSAWYQGDEEFWKSIAPAKGEGERIAKRVGDKWVKLEGELASLRAFCSIDSLTAQMVPAEAEAQTVGPAMAAEGPSVRLDVTHGDTESRTYVLASEPHRIVKWTQGSSGELTFSDFDEEFQVEEPAAGEVFDLAELEK